MKPRSGAPAARRRLARGAGVLVLLALGAAGCRGPKIPAGNQKELNERRRELKEAQRKAEASAAASGEAAPAPPPGASLVAGSARVMLRTADGSGRQVVLRQPLVGRWERVFLSGGGVRDHDRLAPEFTFRDGSSRSVLKLRKLARVEWIAAQSQTRTGVRLRFEFRRADQPAEEFAAEDLMGADHPVVPFLSGIDASGAEVRLPLYAPLEPGGYEPIVEVEFAGPG